MPSGSNTTGLPLGISLPRWRPRSTWLIAPALLLVCVAFIYPTVVLLSRSFTEQPAGLSHYAEFFGSEALVKILIRSIWTAAVVTAVALVVAYPFAYLIATVSPRARFVLLTIVGVSLLVSVIVRSYAWLAILDRNGALNGTLEALGLGRLKVTLVHNFAGVVIGLIQYAIPFMTLPIYDVMRRVDPRLSHAAATLGARPVAAFLRVYFPLTLPGVVAGCAIVFITSLGYYIIPSLLGGPQNIMLSQIISTTMRASLDWGLGASMSAVLLGVAILSFAVFFRATKEQQ